MNPRARVALKLLAGAAVIVLVLAAAIHTVAPGPSGPTGSSYATAPQGVSAYAELLARSGHPVSRLRVAPARARFDSSSTVILLDPARMVSADVTALRQFVQAGGQLVAGGQNAGVWVSHLLSDPPAWSSAGTPTARPLVPVPETSGVSQVLSAGAGSWQRPGATLPVLGAPGSTLLSIAKLGGGRVSLLADSSPLQNAYLVRADNAALGVALAGAPNRPVAFEEGVHGYGEGNGLAALPAHWKWALIGLLLAALLGVAARFRRLAPPVAPRTPPLPPRREHVDALALALERTRRPGEAVRPVREHALAQIRRRAGLDSQAGPTELAQAAAGLGLNSGQVRALTTADGHDDPDEVLAVGSALVSLSESRR